MNNKDIENINWILMNGQPHERIQLMSYISQILDFTSNAVGTRNRPPFIKFQFSIGKLDQGNYKLIAEGQRGLTFTNEISINLPSKNKKKFMEKERKLLHERKPSYSSSEKSLTITSQSSSHSTQPASINPVKLRESSAIRRQRRSWLGHKDELNLWILSNF